MKISDLSFRNLDRRFFIITDKKTSELLLMNEYVPNACALVFCYVNPNAFITFEIVGYSVDGQETVFCDGEPRKVYIDFIANSKCEEIKPTPALLSHPIVNECKKFYEDETVLALREMKELDSVRAFSSPDILNVTIVNGEVGYNGKCRISSVSQSGELICENLCALPFLGVGEKIQVEFTQIEGQTVAYSVTSKTLDFNKE